MVGPKRTPIQRENDYMLISQRYLHGETQAQIAEALHVTQQQISEDLKKIQGRWQKASLIDFNAAKGRELAKIDELERTYWQAWEESKQEKTQTSTKKQGDKTEAAIRREKRDGNAAFLAGVQWCIERRCKLLGIDAPVKIAPTDPTGKEEYGHNYREDLERRLSRLASVGAAAGVPGQPE